MASNILSRLLPPSNNMEPSIYEELRAHDQARQPYDVEQRAGMAVDEENLGGAFHDYDLEQADVFNGEDSRITTESTAFITQPQQRRQPLKKTKSGHTKNESGDRSKWAAQSPRILEDDGDDDVPASLLIEGDEEPLPSQPKMQQDKREPMAAKTPSVPGPSTRETRARWNTAQAHQRLHYEDEIRQPHPSVHDARIATGSPKERALWTWVNVTNMDHFMAEVYNYYLGAGIWCICLGRLLNLL
jgi:autophagy-related protein 9